MFDTVYYVVIYSMHTEHSQTVHSRLMYYRKSKSMMLESLTYTLCYVSK